MRCSDFDAWLDEGMPAAANAAGARVHARGCARCAAELESARAVEALLASGPAQESRRTVRASGASGTWNAQPAPSANFTDRVMARVDALEALHARSRASLPTDPFSWWVRAAMDPASVLSLFLAALLVWQWDASLVFVRSAMNTIASVNVTALFLSLAQFGGVVSHPRSRRRSSSYWRRRDSAFRSRSIVCRRGSWRSALANDETTP